MTTTPRPTDLTSFRAIWLKRYIFLATPALMLMGIVGLIAYLATPRPIIQWGLLIVAAFLTLLAIAYLLLRRGRDFASAILIYTGLLLSAMAGMLLAPDMQLVLVQVPLIAIMLILPFLNVVQFRYVLAIASLVAVTILALGFYQPFGNESFPHVVRVAIICSTFFCITMVLLLLRFYHAYLFQTLERLQQANLALEQNRENLEALAHARTAALAEREQRYRTVSNLTSDFIFALTATSTGMIRLRWATAAFEQITGHSSDIINDPVQMQQVVHPDDWNGFVEHYGRVLAGQRQVWDVRVFFHNQRYHWVRIYAEPIDGNGDERQIIAAIKDISAEKMAEALSEELASKRQDMLAVAQLMLVTHPKESIHQLIEQALRHALDYDMFHLFWIDTDQQLLYPIRDLQPSGQVQPRYSGFTVPLHGSITGEAVATRKPLLVNDAHLDPRSIYPPHLEIGIDHLIILPIQVDGQIIGTVNINRQRNPAFSEAEFETVQILSGFLSLALTNGRLWQQLSSSEERYRRLFEESLDVIYLSQPDGTILDINPAGLALLGYESREEFLKLNVTHDLYVDPQEREFFQQQIADHGAVSDLVSRRRRRDGQVVYVEESARAIRNAEGEVIAYQGYLRDITGRKRAEDALDQVVNGAQCLIWIALVEEWPPETTLQDRLAIVQSETNLPFDVQQLMANDAIYWRHFKVFNHAAAARYFPVAQAPEETFVQAWLSSRLLEDVIRCDQFVVEALRSNAAEYSQEYRYQRADGEIRWLTEDVRITPIGYQRWELVGVCTDVTNRHNQEQKLLETTALLHRQVTELHRREREALAVSRMSQRLQACYSIEEASQATAEAIEQIVQVHAGAIYLRNSDHGEQLLKQVISWGAELPASMEAGECLAMLHHMIDESAGCPFCQLSPICRAPRRHCFPIHRDHMLEGLILLEDDAEHPIEPSRIEMVIRPLELAIANLYLRDTLHRQAIRDPLTGLFNRRAMEESFERELARMERRHASLGVMMLDLDYFKLVNDRYGHATGDRLLQALANFLTNNLRAEDIVCRYGGEEFIMILPESSLEDTKRRAEQLCARAHTIQIMHNQQWIGAVSISIGVASYPLHGQDPVELIHQADMALYQAKAHGRNRVVVAGELASSPLPS